MSRAMIKRDMVPALSVEETDKQVETLIREFLDEDINLGVIKL